MTMQFTKGGTDEMRYARCIEASKRARWTIDEVIQDRGFDTRQTFLPHGFARLDRFPALSAAERCFVGQIQGRT